MSNSKIMKIAIIIGIIIIPVLYSFFYLKAFWDPYGSLENMPIALVNLDKGNEKENLGQELINNLKDTGTMKFDIISQEEANTGLANQDYYAVIEIPEGFTQKLNSAQDVEKQIATIKYSPNQKNNYLASQIINKVVSTAETEITSQVNEKVVSKLSDKLKDIPNKMEEVSDGTEQLLDGTNELSDGANKLQAGTKTLSEKNEEFNYAIHKLGEGTEKINKNYKKIDTGISSAKEGTEKLTTGTNKLSTGVDTLNKGITKASKDISISLTTSAKELDKGIETVQTSVNSALVGDKNSANYVIEIANTKLKTSLNDAIEENLASYVDKTAKAQVEASLDKILNDSSLGLTDAQIKKIKSAAVNNISTSQTIKKVVPNIVNTSVNESIKGQKESIKNISTKVDTGFNTLRKQVSTSMSHGTKEITKGIGTLQSGAKTLQKNVDEQLVPGAKSLNNGMKKLNNGSETMKTGIDTLSTSTGTISDASDKLLEGSNTLESGIATLAKGVGTLSNGTKTFKTEVDKNISNSNEELKTLNGLSEYASEPIEIQEEDYGKVESYGIGFAPYFMSLSLWVGSLISLVVLYNDPEKRFKLLGMNSKNRYLRILCYTLIAAAQGIVLGFVLKLGLGYTVTNIWLYYGICILASLVFLSIIQFLIINFGDVGKFIAILFLVLQLSASGGTFPIETVPDVFQKFYSFMPMTYTVKLFKEALIQIDSNLLCRNLIILGLIWLFFLVANIVGVLVKKHKEKSLEIKA